MARGFRSSSGTQGDRPEPTSAPGRPARIVSPCRRRRGPPHSSDGPPSADEVARIVGLLKDSGITATAAQHEPAKADIARKRASGKSWAEACAVSSVGCHGRPAGLPARSAEFALATYRASDEAVVRLPMAPTPGRSEPSLGVGTGP